VEIVAVVTADIIPVPFPYSFADRRCPNVGFRTWTISEYSIARLPCQEARLPIDHQLSQEPLPLKEAAASPRRDSARRAGGFDSRLWRLHDLQSGDV